MDRHAVETLEFAKVRDLLAEGAASELGLEAIAALAPTEEREQVERWQGETSEVRRILDAAADIPLGGLHDLRTLLRDIGIGHSAEPGALLRVAETLRCVGAVQRFFADRERVTRLREIVVELVALEPLREEIERCITDEGEVADDATPELRRLRAQVRNLGNRLQTTLRRLLSDLAGSDAIQDAVVTIREGRYCVPVKTTHQGQFEGIIHDRSASGQTVFMEPAAVVRLNNELRDAQLAERDEVQRILSELSGRVAAERDTLELNLRLLQRLDLARARGRLSLRLNGTEPRFGDDGAFELRQARHPLLVAQLGERVVPIDLALGDGFDTLLITGPNTGGKTVSLKTVGLLTLMAQAGLHIPAEEGSRLPLCRDVFADIGDEQSLEQSLSTFGGHLKQIVRILERAQSGDLVLLDEIGAGTDPVEGAALAEAVLASLHERGCRVVATTHHGSLKRFAYEIEGVENASVEFDSRSLQPTYRLLVGVPGASHAFEIAKRYGMPDPVLEAARRLLPEGHEDASAIISEMQASRQRIHTEMRAAEHEAAAASHERRELERERRRLRDLEREIREDARRDAAKLLEQVQREADQILGELRGAQKEGKRTEKARQRLRSLRSDVRETKQAAPRKPAAIPTSKPQPIEGTPRLGDTVEVLRLGVAATVTAIDSDQLEVQAGAMRMMVDPAEVVLLSRAEKKEAPTGRRDVGPSQALELELHLRGQTVEEALYNLERYLDQAVLSSAPEVRIVHGKGTGTLKKVVQEYLRQHPYVKSYDHPPENMGGSGVTVAKLDS